jgi:hypothetical protein
MPGLVLIPVWAACIILGIALFFFPRLKFLSARLMLGSTIGVLCSFAVSNITLIVMSTLTTGRLVRIGYYAGLTLGAVIGAIVGVMASWTLNAPVVRKDRNE